MTIVLCSFLTVFLITQICCLCILLSRMEEMDCLFKRMSDEFHSLEYTVRSKEKKIKQGKTTF